MVTHTTPQRFPTLPMLFSSVSPRKSEMISIVPFLYSVQRLCSGPGSTPTIYYLSSTSAKLSTIVIRIERMALISEKLRSITAPYCHFVLKAVIFNYMPSNNAMHFLWILLIRA
jgi:hypothetical protein